jgi:hypothetical protein
VALISLKGSSMEMTSHLEMSEQLFSMLSVGGHWTDLLFEVPNILENSIFNFLLISIGPLTVICKIPGLMTMLALKIDSVIFKVNLINVN